MKPFVLLGAGASVDAKIPDAAAMTEQFVQAFACDPLIRKESHALRYVIGGLILQQGAKGENPFDGINIEDVFNAMYLLATRQLFEAAPFIAGWHAVVEELDVRMIEPRIKHEVAEVTQQVNCSIARNIDSILIEMMTRGQSSRRIGDECRRMVEDSLRNLKSRLSRGGEQPGEGRVFRSTCNRMIQKLVDLVWIQYPGRVQYLKPLVTYAANNGIGITTLNYDNTVELAAAQDSLSVSTGLEGPYLPTTKDVNLIKLHGSIDWSRDETAQGEHCLPYTRISRVAPEKMKERDYKPAVIFGHRNKLTAEGPYLALLMQFQTMVEDADRLIVIGYSFRDVHVNEFLARWFDHRPERTITVVTPDKKWQTRSQFAECLSRIPSRVEVIDKSAAEAIPTLFST